MANVTFSPNHQPAPACYPGDVNAMLDMLTTGGGLSGTVPDNAGGGIFVGSTPPSSSLTNKVWYKVDAAGRPLGVFMFYNGNWRKVYTGAIIGEIRMYIGSQTAFDGTGRGIVGGDLDGWALCNGQNGTPNLEGYFPVPGVRGSDVSQPDGWYTDADGVAWRSSGGRKGPITLASNNMPSMQYEFFYESFPVGTGAASPNVLIADGTKPKGYEWVVDYASHIPVGPPASLPMPMQYIAMGFIEFIGYQ